MQKILLYLTAFFGSSVVMVFELLMSRMYAPFFGTSSYIWTIIIGTVMIAMAAGYYLGGYLADRSKSPQKDLSLSIFLSGALVFGLALFYNPILAFMMVSSNNIILSTFASSVILLVPVGVLLSFTSPFVIRIFMNDLSNVGKKVGGVYSFSTLGSIAGTFCAGFILIPLFGTTDILFLMGLGLVVLGLLLSLTSYWLYKAIIAGILIILTIIFGGRYTLAETMATSEQKIIADLATNYMRVWITDEQRGVITERTLANNQSGIYIIPTEGDDYILPSHPTILSFRLFEHFRPKSKTMLMIGGAGYALPMWFQKIYANGPKEITVVELDGGMLDIAKEYFYFTPDTNFTSIVQDGRTFLNTNTTKFDVIFMDAFKDGYSIPFELTTREANELIYDSLTEDGLFMINLISSLDNELTQRYYNTLNLKFENVHLYPLNYPYDSDLIQNILVVAEKKAGNYVPYSADPELHEFLIGEYREYDHFAPDIILTDDYAPTEYYFAL